MSEHMRRTAKESTQRSNRSTTKTAAKAVKGFTAEERAAGSPR
jgi:hypothetical protein